MGAVSTTTIAGVIAIRKGLAKPIGSLTQMGTIRLGKRTEGRSPLIKDFVPLASLDDIVFGGWDIFEDNCLRGGEDRRRARHGAARADPARARGDQADAGGVRSALRQAARRPERQEGQEQEGSRRAAASRTSAASRQQQRLRSAGDGLVRQHRGLSDRIAGARQTSRRSRRALEASDDSIPSSMIYAYAAIKEGIPYANAAPNLSADIPALLELAAKTGSPLARQGPEDRADADQDDHRARPEGAPARRRGLVLDQHPRQSRRRGARRSGVVQDEGREQEVGARLHPPAEPLSGSLRASSATSSGSTTIRRAATTRRAGTTSTSVGWLGYPMQLKINFLCRDSILAAPIVLDVALFLDLAKRAGMCGIQEWLSFYFKSPMHAPGLYPEHDLFIQLMKLKNTLRYLQRRRADHAPRPRVLRLSGLRRQAAAGAARRARSSACCRRCRSSAPATAAAACGWSRGGVARRLPAPAELPTPIDRRRRARWSA